MYFFIYDIHYSFIQIFFFVAMNLQSSSDGPVIMIYTDYISAIVLLITVQWRCT